MLYPIKVRIGSGCLNKPRTIRNSVLYPNPIRQQINLSNHARRTFPLLGFLEKTPTLAQSILYSVNYKMCIARFPLGDFFRAKRLFL